MASATSSSDYEHPIPRKLWEHPNPEKTAMARFKCALERTKGLKFNDFFELHDWSVKNRSEFWAFVWDYFPFINEGTYARVVDETARMDSIPRWFEGVRLNFAENILYSISPHSKSVRSTIGKEDDKIAITEVREGCSEIRHLTWGELRRKVGKLAQAMKASGVRKGDRVAIVASNSVDTACVFFAVTSLGGLFSSSSTDMGVKGILDRLVQIKPKWIFMDDWAVYNGKTIDLRSKMRDIVKGMERVQEFRGLVSQPRFQSSPADISYVPRSQTLARYLEQAPSSELEFNRVEFSDPFLIVYSSGTTGQPKCIVHSTGGVLMSSQKEARLHHGIDESSTKLQYTTTGWIMYIVQAQGMLVGARAVMYDGSPFLPDLTRFVKLIGDEGVTHLGASPRFLQTLQTGGVCPREVTDLSQLQAMTSTGMVLSEALFEWFYDKGFPPHVHLGNISGGTDIAACFGAENPLLPVYVGGCQSPSLGVPIAVFDQEIEGGKGVKGRAVQDGVPGELVATKAFPNMPATFWGEGGKEKYWSAYFEKFDDVWTHGDFIMIHPITKQILFLGRADGVLNPSGVRFGSADIYNVVDAFFSDRIQDSICVGQRRPRDPDESVMLFLLMKPGVPFTATLVDQVKETIARECSKRHVPKYVFETPEIPTTVNLKKVELPVKQIVSGKVIKPSGTLLNPGCLDYYYRFAKVEEVVGVGVDGGVRATNTAREKARL